jgi:cytochrome c-type biogenesis protein CcmH
MMTFFLLATLLVSIALLAIHLIWTYRRKANLTLNNADWQVMLAKRNEIENDILLPQETQIALRNEWTYMADAVLSRQHESNNMPHQSTQLSDNIVKKYNTLWILVPSIICAMLIYYMIGNWNAEALKLHTSALTPADISSSNQDLPITDNPLHPGSNDSIEKLISQLEEKLKESPNNLDGWVLLSRSLAIKQDYSGASLALEHALKLAPGHPDLLADLADMLAMTNNKSLAGRPTELIQEALKNAPNHPKALSLAATAAMQNNELKKAVSYWKQLRATFPPEVPDVSKIDAIIASIGDQGENAAPMQTRAMTARVPDLSPASGREGQNEPLRDFNGIEGRVKLSSQLRDKLSKTKLPENATLFIVAKSPSGPPMPLAVARFPAQQLMDNNDIAFKLDDSQAMSPMLKLSSQPQVNLEARISMSGTAGKQAGDLYVALPDVRLGAKDLLLEIHSVL